MSEAGLFAGRFRQTAWITNDFDRALEVFKRDYGVPAWLELRDYDMQTGEGAFAKAHIALARRGGVELEVIQPLDGADQVYRTVLTDAPGLQIRFHHVCFLYDEAEALEQVRQAARAKGRPIVLEGGMENGLRYFYTDERATLGHHIEYIYYPAEMLAALDAAIPQT
jgi:hypothetical protein